MDVVVIGAGLSGLTAASVLREAGANVQIFEAAKRIGGRIRALRVPSKDAPVADLGPTWVWPKYQPVVERWLGILGAATFEQFNDGDAVIMGYGPTALRQPLPGQDGMVRIEGGPSALIDTLCHRIGPRNIRTLASVTEVSESGPDHMAVHLGSGEVVTVKKVIISVPLRVAATTINLPWATSDLIQSMRRMPTWMSTQAKAVAIYDTPFWRDDGLSGRVASRMGPLAEVHDHTGVRSSPAALFGFVSWSPQQRKAEPERLRQAILDQLSDCFGNAAAHPLDLTILDWAVNPRIATELDILQPASHPDSGPAHLRQPFLGGRVRFAVSEVSERSPGLIEGAFAIGEKAAQSVLDN
jgi:monoamine oxidase